MIITKDTKLIDVLNTATGNDIIARLFYALGLSENILTKTYLKNLKLSALKTITLGQIDDEVLNALVKLLNTYSFEIDEEVTDIKPVWWKEAIFYQIYPRSFKDSNNDGIGDINGITSKLDYLRDLGINALWICPFYDSPNADNGYDIRDYKKIMKEFGTLDDVKILFDEAHKRNIKVIIDLVMNHTSDEHEWFKKSMMNIEPYNDYYIWRDKPNNWGSLFSGSAWKYFFTRGQYALHLFATKQMDLNWDNPKVRKEMYDVANFWLDFGCDGFRMDVISFISKADGLPDGNNKIGKLINIPGIEHYFHGPHLDEYLHEFYENTIKLHDAYTVGECPGAGVYTSRFMTGDDMGKISQLFSFDHIDNPGHMRYDIYDFDLRKMIPEIVKWQTKYSNHSWPTLFFNNHDNPRMLSKIEKKETYHKALAKLLVTLQMALKGTPYIYQGDEIGMTNYPFKSIDEFRDIESLNMYKKEATKRGLKKEKALKRIIAGSRDNSRTPFQWSNETYGGFSRVRPWIDVNPNYSKINVKDELKDNDSILNYYKKAINLRHNNKTLIYGEFKSLKTNSNIFMFERNKDDESFVIIANLTSKGINSPLKNKKDLTLLLSNYEIDSDKLNPYEIKVYKKL